MVNFKMYVVFFLLAFPLSAMKDSHQWQEDEPYESDEDEEAEKNRLLFEQIIANKAVRLRSNPFCALHIAISLNDKEEFEQCLKDNPKDINLLCSYWKERPLHLSATQQDPYMLQKLIKKNALLNEPNMRKFTPLMLAVEGNKIRNVKILLSQPEIDTLCTNDDGKTALEMAKEKGHMLIGKMLILHCSLYSKQGLIAKEGLCQKIPSEIARHIASYYINTPSRH